MPVWTSIFTHCQQSDEEQGSEGRKMRCRFKCGETLVYFVAEKGDDGKEPKTQGKQRREEKAGRRGHGRTWGRSRRGRLCRGQAPAAPP